MDLQLQFFAMNLPFRMGSHGFHASLHPNLETRSIRIVSGSSWNQN